MDEIIKATYESPPNEKISKFHLIDAIIKGNDIAYISAFSPKIEKLFIDSFTIVPDDHKKSLCKLLMIWEVHFQPRIISNIMTQL